MKFIYWLNVFDAHEVSRRRSRSTFIAVDCDTDLFCIRADTGWTSDLTNAHDDHFKAFGIFVLSFELPVSQTMSQFRTTPFLSAKLQTLESQVCICHLFFFLFFLKQARFALCVCTCVCTYALLLLFSVNLLGLPSVACLPLSFFYSVTLSYPRTPPYFLPSFISFSSHSLGCCLGCQVPLSSLETTHTGFDCGIRGFWLMQNYVP